MNNLYTSDGKLICPNCNEAQDILSYTPLKQKQAKFTLRVIKCKKCRFVFAPNP